ncbi:MAG: hypothetical protein R2852_08915 [Bacteroidia bacterium]
MENKELNHEESLALIQDMINLAKNKINETGFHFLLWGVLVILASLTQYFMIQTNSGYNSNLVWPIMSAIGLPFAFMYERRRSKSGVSNTKFDRIYGFVWLGFGITLCIALAICISNHINPIAFILMLVGLATFVSGTIYRYLPLIIGAIVFWVSAVIASQLNGADQLLLNAIAILLGYVIPGLLLWNKSKRENRV